MSSGLQDGQAVQIETTSIARVHLFGKTGRIVGRDVVTGRYSARLDDEPWRSVKVPADSIRAIYDYEAEAASASWAAAGETPRRKDFWGAPPTKCDYFFGTFQKAPRRRLEALVEGVSNQASPRRPASKSEQRLRAALQDSFAVGDLYREIAEDAPPLMSEDRKEVHRHRKLVYSNLKDNDVLSNGRSPLLPLPPRHKMSVYANPGSPRRRPLQLLPSRTSEELAALSEAASKAKFDEMLHESRYPKYNLPQPMRLKTPDSKLEKEMDVALERLTTYWEKVNLDRHQAELEAKMLREPHLYEDETFEGDGGAVGSASAQLPEKEAEAEDLEQRISREFREYEMDTQNVFTGSLNSSSASVGKSLAPEAASETATSFWQEAFEGEEGKQDVAETVEATLLAELGRGEGRSEAAEEGGGETAEEIGWD